MSCGSTLKSWWNLQRMWFIRRTTSYFIAFINVIKGQLGLSETTFALTNKVVTKDALMRYEQEIMEFGSSDIMFTILSTLALLNSFTLLGGIMRLVVDLNSEALEEFIMQIVLCGIIVVTNLPIYEALFIRSDEGCLPSSVMFKSIVLASIICLMPIC
ncbi:Cellulose synthase-like protein E [Trema orientale]|uniref:Cellulose synthase-like protein E n=1 Tax=Trema orientale TaxID=63057 RepID=A0A2P5EL75_TREOI|nr:Cellulose synthase-like protein E [Trema orientale]